MIAWLFDVQCTAAFLDWIENYKYINWNVSLALHKIGIPNF